MNDGNVIGTNFIERYVHVTASYSGIAISIQITKHKFNLRKIGNYNQKYEIV